MSGKKSVKEKVNPARLYGEIRHSPEQIRDLFRNGTYPYKTRIKTVVYEQHKEDLQVELLKVQNWVKQSGQRIVGLFEGRDAAGKGGTIKRFMEHLNPRAARVVALQKPTDQEKGQWYFQRYIKHLPTSGEMVFSIAPGATVPASSVSWVSAVRSNTWNSCDRCRILNACFHDQAYTCSSTGFR